MPCKTNKVLIIIICFPSSYNCILEKDILKPFSCINTQRIIPKRKIDPILDHIIKIPNSVSNQEHDSLIILQLV
jgi:hypothetical protein